MTQREIVEQQVENAKYLIATWPTWKRNILVHSSMPMFSTPRTPIDEQAPSSDQEQSQEVTPLEAAG